MRKIALLDRDGTLIKEPADFQVDTLEKLELVDYVIPALLKLQERGYELVMVTNQDYLGSEGYPQASYDLVQEKMLSLFSSQGIEFNEIYMCPHGPSDNCTCRKPLLGMLPFELIRDVDREVSFMVGDRESDLVFARNLGIKGYMLDNSLDWNGILSEELYKTITIEQKRKTKETDIQITLSEEAGKIDINTGIGFFDHMLNSFAKYSGLGLSINVEGDLEIDTHHTIEDVAIVLGAAFKKLQKLNPYRERFAYQMIMDEAVAKVTLDMANRVNFSWGGKFNAPMIGEMPSEMIIHFFKSLTENAGWSIKFEVSGDNDHHQAEVLFKCLGKSLKQAFLKTDTLQSTKGVL